MAVTGIFVSDLPPKVLKETIRPYVVNNKPDHSSKLFERFFEEVHEIAKYHSDPNAFVLGHLMSYMLRYNEDSQFYRTLQESYANYNFSRPFVG